MAETVYITSRSNPAVCAAASLSERKFRERDRLFRFDGEKLFREACACGVDIVRVFIREDREGDLLGPASKLCPGAVFGVLPESVFSRLTAEKSPEGIVSVAKYIDNLHKSVTIIEDGGPAGRLPVPETGKVIALEAVRDPGNVGTVIRSAAAFGFGTVLMSDDCADIYNPKTVRAAMGALFSRRIVRVRRLADALRVLRSRGRRVYAAALEPGALPFGGFRTAGTDVFVVGNEGHGLSEEVVSACDATAFVPMETGPGIESLNAAVAASVIMYGLSREPGTD
jgi:TrmH family RNA methyltransferase